MTVIAQIKKNAREEIRIIRQDFNGHDLINIRVFYDAGDDMRPSYKGLAFKVALLPDVLDALSKTKEVVDAD